MSEIKPKGEPIADYAYLDKTQRSWNLWAGNPFCISLYRLPLTLSRENVISMVKKGQARERQRFTKKFKDVKWEIYD